MMLASGMTWLSQVTRRSGLGGVGTTISFYLVQQGYTNCGTTWLRGQNGYARMERLTSGAIRIIEGVA